jgi:hypothetical protein
MSDLCRELTDIDESVSKRYEEEVKKIVSACLVNLL